MKTITINANKVKEVLINNFKFNINNDNLNYWESKVDDIINICGNDVTTDYGLNQVIIGYFDLWPELY